MGRAHSSCVGADGFAAGLPAAAAASAARAPLKMLRIARLPSWQAHDTRFDPGARRLA
jgi:hypothetical protein